MPATIWRDNHQPKRSQITILIAAHHPSRLSRYRFPAQHRQKLHSTNTVERLNREVKRRSDVVGIFPNESSIIRLIGAVLLEANDEWATQHRYMQVEAMAELLGPPLIEGKAASDGNTETTRQAA